MKHFNLSSRSARAKLKPRTAPYYSRVRVGRSLGYRRLPGSQIGRWQLRYRDERGNYVVSSMCQADDLPTGQNSLAALTYEEAFSHVQRFDPTTAKSKPATLATVSQCCDHYVKLVVLPNHNNPAPSKTTSSQTSGKLRLLIFDLAQWPSCLSGGLLNQG